MKGSFSLPARDAINIYAQLADLKEIDYRNTLAIAALIELLEEKGLLTPAELAERMKELDAWPPPAASDVPGETTTRVGHDWQAGQGHLS